MVIVVDASVALGWLFTNQSSKLTHAALDHATDLGAIVPAHFSFEIGMVLRARERLRGLSRHELNEMVADLQALNMTVDNAHPVGLIGVIAALSCQQSIKYADAGYLELAIRRNLPLATRDAALANAAKAVGVNLFAA